MNKLQINNEIRHICLDPKDIKDAPFKTNDPNYPDSDKGLIPTIWGPHEWESIHSKTFGYPINPTYKQKIRFLLHFITEGDVLPCVHCGTSYKRFISEGDTFLDMNVMESRETLTKWGYRLHKAVNKKLGVDYGETYEELCYKYESSRAKCDKNEKDCTMSLAMKAQSYKITEIKRAPIIDIKYCLALIDHAKTLGMENYDKYLSYHHDISFFRSSKEWQARDRMAKKIINHMRTNGISSLDSSGMPSYFEMALISMLSSTLEREKLDEIYQKISNQTKKFNILDTF